MDGNVLSIPHSQSAGSLTSFTMTGDGNDILKQCSGFLCECTGAADVPWDPRFSEDKFEYQDPGALWFRNYFIDELHLNFLGIDASLGPVIISIIREESKESDRRSLNKSPLEESSSDENKSYSYRIILRTSEGMDLRTLTRESDLKRSASGRLRNKKPSAKDVVQAIAPRVQTSKLRFVTDPTFPERLLKIDEQNVSKQYKIGVLLMRKGQISEEDIYSNENDSKQFSDFLNDIGTNVRLREHHGFRGGLDTKNDTTGTHTVYSTVGDREIMFHVAPLLPNTKENDQYVQRKRHVGNDIVTIIFQEEGSSAFSPKIIRSHFQHVFVVIRPEGDSYYRVAVARFDDIPNFGPELPTGGLIRRDSTFGDWLLTKLINAEHASYKSACLLKIARRTRSALLKSIVNDVLSEDGSHQNLPKNAAKVLTQHSRQSSKDMKVISRPILSMSNPNAHYHQLWNVKVKQRNGNLTPRLLQVMSNQVLLRDDTTQCIERFWPIETIISVQPQLYGLNLTYFEKDDTEQVLSIHTRDAETIVRAVEAMQFAFSLSTPTDTLRKNGTPTSPQISDTYTSELELSRNMNRHSSISVLNNRKLLRIPKPERASVREYSALKDISSNGSEPAAAAATASTTTTTTTQQDKRIHSLEMELRELRMENDSLKEIIKCHDFDVSSNDLNDILLKQTNTIISLRKENERLEELNNEMNGIWMQLEEDDV